MTRPALAARRAFALPAALGVLVLLTALVAGALFVSTEEVRAGRTELAQQRSLAAAEWGAERAIAQWDPASNVALEPGRAATLLVAAPVPGTTVEVAVTRLRPRALWLVAHAATSGDRAGPAARQAVGTSLRLVGPRFASGAALTAAGQVVVADGGTIDGRAGDPAEWGSSVCRDAGEAGDVAGVAVPDTTRVCGSTCGGDVPLLFGDPPKLPAASALDPAAYERFGDESLAQLAGRAAIVLPGGVYAPAPAVAGGSCHRGAPLNWGDPARATSCADHAPVIHVRGDLTLAPGSAGQGVLLVDGDVRVEPGAWFAGVVVAGDDVVVSGPGAAITGAVLARDRDAIDGSSVAGGGAVRYAPCAVARAELAAARLARTPVRWWAELR